MDKPNRPQRKNERMKEILNSGIFFSFRMNLLNYAPFWKARKGPRGMGHDSTREGFPHSEVCRGSKLMDD